MDEHDLDFDVTLLPECGDRLDPSFMVDVVCQLVDDSFIHSIHEGHVGIDKDQFVWNWTALGARMIIPEEK